MAELEPAYLVLGTDRPKTATVVARMRRHFEDAAVESYDAISTSAADIVTGCMAMGLFAARRLIVVHGADAWKADDVSALLGYLESPSPDVVLLLTATKLAANSRLKKAFPKPRLVEVKGPEKEADVIKWAAQAFQRHGATADPLAARRLVQLVGFDSLDRLESEIARIVVYANGDLITPELVEQQAVPVTEEKVWALTDAWASRDRARLLAMAEQLLAQREHPVRLVGVIARHLRYVHRARRLLAHESAGQVQHRLVDAGVNKWVAPRYVEQAQRIGLAQADAALARVALLDAELRGGAALSSGKVSGDRDAATIVFERGLAELL